MLHVHHTRGARRWRGDRGRRRWSALDLDLEFGGSGGGGDWGLTWGFRAPCTAVGGSWAGPWGWRPRRWIARFFFFLLILFVINFSHLGILEKCGKCPTFIFMPQITATKDLGINRSHLIF